jgi:hypothetical protein
MPDLLGLRLQSLDQVGIGMAAGRDCDAGAEIQISLAVFSHQPYAFTALEAQGGTGKSVEKGRFSHGDITPEAVIVPLAKDIPENQNAAHRAAAALSPLT